MYLKSLEMQGFKSFPDKIRLTFDEGLTAVVGPNGSGKSNIGDAVRWVLGEQSTKELRGKSMEDVIFSGTKSRKPMGFAAVTLTIENSDRALSEDADEVSVTRKLYRSGDSEYLINGKPVRLRDVNELFMDTGLGRDGYAIIGQGRIAEIVGAKSGERRDIFEEAAGVSKFRYKKQEAERRLEAAQENITRLKDILGELESRLGPLKVQSEKAEKYLALARERETLEVSFWVDKLRALDGRLRELSETFLRLSAEYENLQSDIAREEEKVRLAFQDMQQTTVDIETLQNKIVRAEQEHADFAAGIAVCETEIRHCEDKIGEIQKQSGELDAARGDGQARLAEQDDCIEALAQRQKALEEELRTDEAELEYLTRQEQDALSRCEESDGVLRGLYLQRSEAQTTLSHLESEIAEAEQTLSRAEQDGNSAERRLKEAQENKASLERKIEDANRKITEDRNRLSGFEELLARREEKYRAAAEEQTRLRGEYQQTLQRQQILRDLEQNMEGYAGSVRQILKASGAGRLGGVHGTVAQRITVQPEYGTAVETALGGALQNLIVENEETAKRCIRYLKEARGGRATFLPLTTIHGSRLRENLQDEEGFVALACDLVKYEAVYRGIMESLLGRIAVAEDIDSASRIAGQYQYRFRVVTLDGQVIHAGGSYTGGSAARSAGVITRTHELEETGRKLRELEAQNEKQRAEADKRKAQWSQTQTLAQGAKAQLSQDEQEALSLNQALAALCARMESDAAWRENESEQRERLERKAGELRERKAAAQKSLSELEETIRKNEETLRKDTVSQLRVHSEKAIASQKIAADRVKAAELSKDLENERRRRIAMAQEVEHAQERKESLKAQLREQKAAIGEKRREIERLRGNQKSGREQIERMQQEITRLRQGHEERERAARLLREGMDELREAAQKQSMERTRCEERKAAVQREIDDLIFRLRDTYELSRSEAEERAQPIEDRKEAEARLNTLRNKIRALGSVNVGAVEEYREVSERHTFLRTQMDDVTRAKQELETLIETLTEDMRKIFLENFTKISGYFGEIFRDLFGGGSASLELTDPENVLESGIEIHVAPPGKVIRNLIALSGGEQSFVAICVYFAILKLRPAPFCILDEIDAALDEVNVRKYAQYLKRSFRDIQFIVITHRRGAMDEANVLYGVTMQEDGVSRLLRLDQNGMSAAESAS